jgi:hypothetical protein
MREKAKPIFAAFTCMVATSGTPAAAVGICEEKMYNMQMPLSGMYINFFYNFTLIL